jgi:hypothetical protein
MSRIRDQTPQDRRENPCVVECVVRALLLDAIVGRERGQSAIRHRKRYTTSERQCAQPVADRNARPDPAVLAREEAIVEACIVRDHDPTRQQLGQLGLDVLETWCPTQEFVCQAVDVDRTRITPRIDKGVELPDNDAFSVQGKRSDRQHPVIGGTQP